MCIVRLAMDRFFTQKELRWIDQLIPEAPSRRSSTPMSVSGPDGDQPFSTSPRESPTDSKSPLDAAGSPQLPRAHKLRRPLLSQAAGGGAASRRVGRRASSVDTTDNNASTALLSSADTDDTPLSPRQALFSGSGGSRNTGFSKGGSAAVGVAAGGGGGGRGVNQKSTSTSIRSTCSSGLGTSSSSSMEAHPNLNFISSSSAASLASPSHWAGESGAGVGVTTIRELDENGDASPPNAVEIEEDDDMRHLMPSRRGSHFDKRPSIFSLGGRSQDEPEVLAEQLYDLDVGAELCNTSLWKDLAQQHEEDERRSRRGTGSRRGSALQVDQKEREQKRESELPAWKRCERNASSR